jgi:hypothetical protein
MRTILLILLGMLFATPALATALPVDPTPVLAPERVEIDGQAQIRLDEGRVFVQSEYHLRVHGAGIATLKKPLRIPLLAPVVGGVVLDAGVLPVQGQSVELEQEGKIQIARQNGGLEVTGTITQEQPGVVRVRYPVAVRGTSLRLGIAGRGNHTWMTVVVQGAAPARVRLAVDRPARLSRFEQAADRLVGASLARPLRNGEVAVFALEDLPGPPRTVRRGLLGLGAVLAILALGVLWAHRPREEGPA